MEKYQSALRNASCAAYGRGFSRNSPPRAKKLVFQQPARKPVWSSAIGEIVITVGKIVFALTLFAPLAIAETGTVGPGITYTYTGHSFTFTSGAITSSNHVSASMTFQVALPANCGANCSVEPSSWVISDGVSTLTSSDGISSLLITSVTTDASGKIANWELFGSGPGISILSARVDFAPPDDSSSRFDINGTPLGMGIGQVPGTWTSTVAPASLTPSITPGRIVPIYSTVNTIQPGEWVSVFGNSLSSSMLSWTGNFPTSLGGTSVRINGKTAYFIYVSPTQINIQAPDDNATGSVPVVVTTPAGSYTSTVTLAPFAPSFCLLDLTHVTGIILRSDGSGTFGGGTYDILGPAGNSLGYPTVAAKAGDTVELFAVGLGPTNPMVPAGQVFSGAAQTTNTVDLFVNGVHVIPTFAGLSSAGLYQINLIVPVGLGTGDASIVATVGGVSTSSNTVMSLQ
jgi:uncharacterized protein (TIGR03437 family)